MQKFVIKKTQTSNAETQSHLSMNGTGSQVRLSGYLKKKRIKVGGWKKLWFVLQNQLILSYNSKEDYEERLAPFKDVISLVPGTQVLPMQQNRFTIETTGKALYIFRCDDPKSCSEWITALMESLNGNTAHDNMITCMNTNFHIPPMFCDTTKSLGSGLVITKKFGDMTVQQQCQQLDSLNFYGGSSYQKGANRQIARLPIAPITAKILQRGSFHEEVEENDIDSGNGEMTTIQNFRLHDELTSKLAENQSIDVSRINSMFHACEYSTTTVLSLAKQPTTILNGGDCVETTVNFKKLIKCEIVQNSTNQVDIDDNNEEDNNKRVVTAIKFETPKNESTRIENNHNENNNKIDIINKSKHNDESKSVNDRNLNRTNVNEKVNNNDQNIDQAINLKSKDNTNDKSTKVEKRNSFLSQITNGKSVFDNMKKFIVKKSAANTGTDLNRNLSNGRPVNASLDTNTNVKENTDVVDYCNIEEQIQNITLEDEDDTTEYEDENDNPSEKSTKENPSYLSVNQYQISSIIKRNSYQNITEIEIPPQNSSITMNHSPKNSLREIGTNLSEVQVPLTEEAVVYATINLEDKHSRRALRSTESPEKSTNDPEPDQLSQSKPLTNTVPTPFTSDYEEVGMFIENDGSEDETIYEPVDIPKSNNHAAALWNNLKRINVDALWLDLTRKMREKTDTDEASDSHAFGTFRDFKRKLGDHRRSLKARMQKMYHRSDSRQSSSEEKEIHNGDRSSVCSSSLSHNSSNNGNNGIPLPGLTNTKLFAVNDNVIKELKHKSNKNGSGMSRASKLKARITFGSLGRVKKSRTSMFFEEFVPAKKITMPTTDLPNIDFQKELMSVVCETKIPADGAPKKEEQITERCHNVGHESI